MPSDILSESFQLLIYGMGTVFIFLYILVLVTTAMSRLVLRFAPEPEPVIAKNRQSAKVTAVEPDILKAIGLAVQEYRREHH